MCLGPKTLHYAKFWAQNATKTSAGNTPESLSNLFLRDNCRLSQRLLNNANKCFTAISEPPLKVHRGTKGRFRKRVVVANVPLVPVFFLGGHANVPSFRLSFQWNIRMYPRSGFRSGGTSPKTTLLETTLLSTPEKCQTIGYF